jgi:acylphosphatase
VALGLDGWVRNRDDGGVEALLTGPAERVDAMVEACRSGPTYAHVDRLEVSATIPPPGPGFHILPGR